MSDYTYKLDMAGFLWEIVSPIELDARENCAPFLTDRPGADVSLRFRLEQPPERGAVVHDRSPCVWQEDGALRIERLPAAAVKPCACVWMREDDPFSVTGCIYPDRTNLIRSLDNLLDASELELLLTKLGIFSLHSSLVRRREGDAILFTAPSGTGKSTQADLWVEYAGADILNGDRSMLRRVDGVWTAFGSPFAGSSSIFRNESAPVRALVVLRQAPENAIRRLSLAEAFRAIYSESVLPRWHTEAHQRVISLVTEIVSEVPVYLLACTPDERPVTLLRNTLEGEPK
jgi:hypothetical protein